VVSTDRPATSPATECTALLYQHGALRDDLPLAGIDRQLRDQQSLVWLDLERPSDKEFELLAREFNLHPLAIEDIRKPHQRPKVDEYEELRLIVLFDVRAASQGHGLALQELDIFVGPNYLITVHARPIHAITELRERWRHNPAMVEPSPLGFLLYHLADTLVDGYFPVVDGLENEIEQIEERLFESFDKSVLRDIFALRRDLIQLRKVLGPERDAFILLSRRDIPIADKTTAPYFSDVVDLLLRLTDTVDTFRDLLGAALDSYLSIQSNSLNEIMKRLTALTVIVMVPTLIAGIYGMNFHHIPELEWEYGYPYAVALMLGTALAAILFFWKKDWL